MSNSEIILKAIKAKKYQGEKLSTQDIIAILEEANEIAEDNQTKTLIENILKKTRNNNFSFLKKLTKREIEVLTLIGKQADSVSISKALDIKLSTVETHRKNIRKKLNIKGKSQLFYYAFISGFLSEDYKLI